MYELLQFWHYSFSPVGRPWYTGGIWMNQLQWTVVWLPSLIVIYRHKFKCSMCWRPAHHPVAGTHYRTCHKHSTQDNHQQLRKKHKAKYPAEHKLLNGNK